ncbi:hypothetical protein GCM10027299_26880 [Larkinella ripae]
MKIDWSMLPLLGLLACGGGGAGSADSDSGGGGRHAANELGRQVSGSRLLSESYQYAMPCDYISESSIESMFELTAETPITWTQSENACEVVVNNKKIVVLSTTSRRPFESVFHADYYFNRLYQPSALTNRGRKRPYTGPEPEGTGAESPAAGTGGNPSVESGAVAGAPNDSAQHHAAPGNLATSQLNDNDEERAGTQPVPGAWEKAVWNAKSRTLHILNLQHVFHITVNHGPTAAADSLNAAKLGSLLIKDVEDEANQGDHPIY